MSFEEHPPPRGHDPRRDPSDPPARAAQPDPVPVPSILPLVGATPAGRELPERSHEPPYSSAVERADVVAQPMVRADPIEIMGLPVPKRERLASEQGHGARPHPITCDDPRLPEVEKLLDLGDWARVVELLGPPDAAGRLPPPLGLAYAVARKEVEAVSLAAADDSVEGPNQLARRCMAALLAVSEESPLALVLSRRMLRQNPISWRRRRAPPAPLSIVIVLLALFLGASIGYVLNFGRITLLWPGN